MINVPSTLQAGVYRRVGYFRGVYISLTATSILVHEKKFHEWNASKPPPPQYQHPPLALSLVVSSRGFTLFAKAIAEDGTQVERGP